MKMYENNDSSSPRDPCAYEFDPNIFKRFVMMGVISAIICCAGTMGNLTIIVTLSKHKIPTANNVFILALAMIDTLVLILTVLLYSVEVIYEYSQNVALYFAWFLYVRVIFVMSHVCQVFSVYITVAATCERCISLWFQNRSIKCCVPAAVLLWLACIFVCVVGLILCKFWEVEVVVHEECPQFGRFELAQGPLLQNPTYVEVYLVWMSNILFIFLPFLLLSVLNSLIWLQLQKTRRLRGLSIVLENSVDTSTTHVIKEMKRYKRKNREETMVLFVVVLVFLLCNFPQVALSMAERIDQEFLYENGEFYTFARDTVNLLTVVNSSSNFLIYLIFGREFRKTVFNCDVAGGAGRSKYAQLQNGTPDASRKLRQQSPLRCMEPESTGLVASNRQENGKHVRCDGDESTCLLVSQV